MDHPIAVTAAAVLLLMNVAFVIIVWVQRRRITLRAALLFSPFLALIGAGNFVLLALLFA